VENFKPLSGFFEAVSKDGRITIGHIGLYAVLLQCWQDNQFQNPVMAFSHEVMSLAKISARATYFKCLNDLNDFGYIRYERSFKRNKRSCIYLTVGDK